MKFYMSRQSIISGIRKQGLFASNSPQLAEFPGIRKITNDVHIKIFKTSKFELVMGHRETLKGKINVTCHLTLGRAAAAKKVIVFNKELCP